ncbi:transcriptional repressor p66-alpha-like [Sinocyclocheilus anshuiensis]|uniref:transcriptional repressor p66-alpha-like n=1 Tax=Sinocyclocheilus anshuiensis TaxID=1608454 RepID=UPI0007B8527F|nr:PREDICTED: transcriptional repressor p66-alpha-like [Sinocyclocheilus anshuiensis]
MCEDAVRQTRSQKHALEQESPQLKLDGSRSAPDSSVLKTTIKEELQTRDEPLDTSNTTMKREARSSSPDDVIILSDEAPSPLVNGGNHVKQLDTDLLMRSSPEERERVVKQLKEELRLEEARLILLKKLRQSHIHKDSGAQKPAAPVSSTAPPLFKRSAAGKTTAPVISAWASPLLSKHSAQIIMPPLLRGAQSILVSPLQVSSLRQQQNSSGPPPLLLAPRATVSSIPGHKIIQPGLIRMTSIPSTGLLLSISQVSRVSTPVWWSVLESRAGALSVRRTSPAAGAETRAEPSCVSSACRPIRRSFWGQSEVFVLPIRVVHHAFSPSSQLQNAVAAAALVSRPGKHAERQESKVSSSRGSSSVRKRSSSAAGVTMAYVNPSLSVQKPVERHREYLLDMISSRSVSQTANSWK